MSTRPLQILVTNDDGIDSVGLHELARAMVPLGEVTVVAPDKEFSGSGAAIGAIFDDRPEVHEATIDGIATTWTVSGPPALCVFYALLGAFGFEPDIVVSGINPGANVGRSVYHSGTVGAALTARNGGIPAVAVSQAVVGGGVEGQAWAELVASIRWQNAATVTAGAVEAMIEADLVRPRGSADTTGSADDSEPAVLNINLPPLGLDEINGYTWATVGASTSQSMDSVNLLPKPGHVGSWTVDFSFGPSTSAPIGTDTRAIDDGLIALSWLGRLEAVDQAGSQADKLVSQRLDGLLTPFDQEER